jgi:hypothetical protein
MKVRKARAISFNGEHRGSARTAVTIRRPVQGVARYYQSAMRISAVAVVIETMQFPKARAIGFDGEHRANAGIAAIIRRPIQGVAR